MDKLIGIKLKYTCPAVTPDGIQLDRVYTLKKDNRGYFVDDGNLEKTFDLELIKMFFTPLGNESWEELEEAEKMEVKEIKEVKEAKEFK